MPASETLKRGPIMSPDSATHCQDHSGHESRLKSTEARLKVVEEAVLDIRARLLARPSWAICVLLTLLSSATVGLAIALIKLKT